MKRFWKHLTWLHRWAGLILGIQIFIWFASGFFMSFFDIETVRGEHIAKDPTPIAADIDSSVLATFDSPITSIKVIQQHGRPMVIVQGENQQKRYDLVESQWLSAPSEAEIKTIAQSYYTADQEPSRVGFLTDAPIEYRKTLPVWQVEFDDKSKTRLYLHPETGELVNVRTRLWRVFDFMWMLHIMDYDDRDDINNWWLWLAALMATLFALSGLLLVIHRTILRPRRKIQEKGNMSEGL